MSAASTARNDADYLPEYGRLTDEALLAGSGGLTELTMFVATYEAQISNLALPLAAAASAIEPRHPVVAINSNFSHKCLPGYERFLKLRPKKALGTRKGQGDRTCFISALEPVIVLSRPDIPASKAYYMKCFPSKGQVQVPGALIPDMSDGLEAIQAWVDLLNDGKNGTPDEAGAAQTVGVIRSRPNMINFKFRIKRAGPRVLIDLYNMALYFNVLEEQKITKDRSLSPREADAALDLLPHGAALLPPPYSVRETKPPIEDTKLTFKFGGVRVKVFQKGKINILGANTFESAQVIHQYIAELVAANHGLFIRIQPRSDADRLAASTASAESAARARAAARLRRRQAVARPYVAVPPVYGLADADVDALLELNSARDGAPSPCSAEGREQPEPANSAGPAKPTVEEAVLEAANEFDADIDTDADTDTDTDTDTDDEEPGNADQYSPARYRERILELIRVGELGADELVPDGFDPDLAHGIMRDVYSDATGSGDGFNGILAEDIARDAWNAVLAERQAALSEREVDTAEKPF